MADLRAKYDAAIQKAKAFRMEGSAEQKGDKLFFNGTVTSEEQRNDIWNALKTVPDYSTEVIADIRVVAPPAGATAAAPAAAAETYTVKAGDTLSAIAKAHLGDASKYHAIFEANKDILTDPDKIKPGQVLKIPTA